MTEGQEQKEFVKWLRATYPQHSHCLRASLSGLNFGAGHKAARMVNHLKGQGVESGESDIVLALPRHGFGSLVIEYKSGEGKHKLSEAQAQYLEKHNVSGNLAMLIKGLPALKQAVSDYISGVDCESDRQR